MSGAGNPAFIGADIFKQLRRITNKKSKMPLSFNPEAVFASGALCRNRPKTDQLRDTARTSLQDYDATKLQVQETNLQAHKATKVKYLILLCLTNGFAELSALFPNLQTQFSGK